MSWLREKIIKMIGYLSLRGHEVPKAISSLEIALSPVAPRNDVVKKKGVPFQDVPVVSQGGM